MPTNTKKKPCDAAKKALDCENKRARCINKCTKDGTDGEICCSRCGWIFHKDTCKCLNDGGC